MSTLAFFAPIEIFNGNPYVYVSAARAKAIKPGWRKPLPVLVRINGKPAEAWRINMMPVGDGGFYLYLHGDVRKASGTAVGDRVRVEIEFDEALPSQARADLSVDGTIAIETLKNVRYVGRPVGAQSGSATTVFRAKPGDNVAVRVPVKFGQASVNQIVVLEGLEPGDIVALADTTQWSGKDRLVID